jgi:hypothetical protein
LDSTRSGLCRGLFGQTLFTKALVPFKGHVLVHVLRKIWTRLMGLAGRNMNVLRLLNNDRFLQSQQVTLLTRMGLSNVLKLHSPFATFHTCDSAWPAFDG